MAECELCNDDGTVEVTVLGSPKWPLGKTDCRCPDCLEREKNGEIEKWKTKYEFERVTLAAAVAEKARLLGALEHIAEDCLGTIRISHRTETDDG